MSSFVVFFSISILVFVVFIYLFFHTMEVNGYQNHCLVNGLR